jgi:hypothetical protein
VHEATDVIVIADKTIVKGSPSNAEQNGETVR